MGITPLIVALSCVHAEVLECLIQAEADINSTDQDGYSPLAYTITGSKSTAIVECLLQAGANPCMSERCKFTADGQKSVFKENKVTLYRKL